MSNKIKKRLKVNKVDALIAEKIMDEKRPTHEVYVFASSKDCTSSKGNWFAHHVYEHGDVTEWMPASFSSNPIHAFRALREFCKKNDCQFYIEGDKNRTFVNFVKNQNILSMASGKNEADAIVKAISNFFQKGKL